LRFLRFGGRRLLGKEVRRSAEGEGATGEYVSGEPKVNGEEEWGTAGKL